MEQIRISAKSIGELALENFCPRCFWIKLHFNRKMPFSVFPGIFSSIDSYSKKITNMHFNRYTQIPKWFSGFGSLGEPVKVPHHTKFNVLDDKTEILFTGVPDDIFYKPDKSYFIVDYKTAKFTGTQDELLPMYEVQLNAYAYIGERNGFKPVSGLGLLYYEPKTDITEANIDSHILDVGFSMNFSGKLLSIDLNIEKIPFLLKKVREIYEMAKPPDGVEQCKDCRLLELLIEVASSGK
jgi:hypothetical protein